MSLTNIVAKDGATWAPTGGTDVTFTTAPSQNAGLITVANYDNPTYREMESISFYGKEAVANNGIFGKSFRKATIYIPRDYDTVYVKNLIKIEAQLHPAMASADKALMLDTAAQLLLSAARDFFTKGTTA
jgi:hypothetical protein